MSDENFRDLARDPSAQPPGGGKVTGWPTELCKVHVAMTGRFGTVDEQNPRNVARGTDRVWQCDRCGCVLSDDEALGRAPNVVPRRLVEWRRWSELQRRFGGR